MDVLQSGSDRPSLAAVLQDRLPAGAVAAVAALVLGAGVLGLGEVRREVRAADDVSAVELRFVVERTRRAGDGSAFGFARVDVVDPAGRPVALLALDVDVPGLRLGPRRGLRLGELEPASSLQLPLRFAVPECDRLVLPGTVTARLSRPGRPADTVTTVVGEPVGEGDDGGREAAVALRRACGLGA